MGNRLQFDGRGYALAAPVPADAGQPNVPNRRITQSRIDTGQPRVGPEPGTAFRQRTVVHGDQVGLRAQARTLQHLVEFINRNGLRFVGNGDIKVNFHPCFVQLGMPVRVMLLQVRKCMELDAGRLDLIDKAVPRVEIEGSHVQRRGGIAHYRRIIVVDQPVHPCRLVLACTCQQDLGRPVGDEFPDVPFNVGVDRQPIHNQFFMIRVNRVAELDSALHVQPIGIRDIAPTNDDTVQQEDKPGPELVFAHCLVPVLPLFQRVGRVLRPAGVPDRETRQILFVNRIEGTDPELHVCLLPECRMPTCLEGSVRRIGAPGLPKGADSITGWAAVSIMRCLDQ